MGGGGDWALGAGLGTSKKKKKKPQVTALCERFVAGSGNKTRKRKLMRVGLYREEIMADPSLDSMHSAAGAVCYRTDIYSSHTGPQVLAHSSIALKGTYSDHDERFIGYVS